LTTLYNFCSETNCEDGVNPVEALVQATDGSFYGGTLQGGADSTGCGGEGCGTVFRITSARAFSVLHNFDFTDGEGTGGLLQATNGTFYGAGFKGGTSVACGTSGCGTIFSLSVQLKPFIATQPASGKVGATVIILGNNLTGATSVTFNGTAATFTVVSSTEIKTAVPAGATSGTVEVTTPNGTLTSNVPFRVTP
ncbi:MAG: choice-of-anchor tandem repeat GloVer-containing protein, partial [Candidatus Sulfotelmatobacter sp.]